MNANEESGLGDHARISLWKLDKLMNGDLPESEAAALREAVSASPEARRYLEKYSSLRSDRLPGNPAARSVRQTPVRPWAREGWERAKKLLRPGNGRRGLGFALASLLMLGAGMWAWRLQGTGLSEGIGNGSHLHPKGLEDILIHITIRGNEIEPGQVASAASGDTLGISYRSPNPVSAQIWFREEGGTAQAMTGADAAPWPAAMGWRPAPVRIVLEGEWHRQMVWVITSFSAFSKAEGLQALDGKSPRANLRADAFRLTR
ncbi:MAG: hypothetical protein JWO30_2080 [Fibrobacteres bacterium]|nr:hypothetical protein [Fibrobacterota bacterium]